MLMYDVVDPLHRNTPSQRQFRLTQRKWTILYIYSTERLLIQLNAVFSILQSYFYVFS